MPHFRLRTPAPSRAGAVLIGCSGRSQPSAAALAPPRLGLRPAHALPSLPKSREVKASGWTLRASPGVSQLREESEALSGGAPGPAPWRGAAAFSRYLSPVGPDVRPSTPAIAPPPGSGGRTPQSPRRVRLPPAPTALAGTLLPQTSQGWRTPTRAASHPRRRRRRSPPRPRVCPINGVGKRHRGIL